MDLHIKKEIELTENIFYTKICFGKHEIKTNNYLSEKECHSIEMHEIRKEMQRQEVILRSRETL